MNRRKRLFNAVFFLAAMGLTFYTVLHGQDPAEMKAAFSQMSAAYMLFSMICALFFVCAEGFMIWYLLKSMEGKSGLPGCIGYSFIGFFYSGITPSATGGQPMQLYYMKKDGNSLSGSSVVLMTVAVIYKFVLVVIGILMLLFGYPLLKSRLHGYFALYLLGLCLNVVLVALLLAVMTAPGVMYSILSGMEKGLVRIRILKASAERTEKIRHFIGGYRDAVLFLGNHKGKVGIVVLCTFLQRGSVFFLTWLVYRGFGLAETNARTVMLLQAAVTIAVDMLPVPGAQGITELMYGTVFADVFTGGLLMPSLCVTRGVSFYFPLLVSLAAVMLKRAAVRQQC